MSELTKVIKERRSPNNFLEGYKIPKEDFDEIFRLLALAPSCFNLQHAHYLIIDDVEKKEALRDAAFKQYKIHTASAAILVFGKLDAYKDASRIYEGMLNLGMYTQNEFDLMVDSITSLYDGRGVAFMYEEAIRNASLSAMMFMLIAKDKGWDTCPMIGFDNDAVKKLYNVPENLIPVLLITMGKEDTKKTRLRGYRKPMSEFVTFNRF